MKKGTFSTILNILVGSTESQTIKQLRKNIAILMEN